MEATIERMVISQDELKRRVSELGADIAARYAEEPGGGDLAVITILKGGFIFLADLIRHIDYPLTVDFLAISGYETRGRDSGVVKITKDLTDSIYGRRVLVVEDIIDTGLTLSYIVKNVLSRYPRDLRICTLLDRRARRIADLDIDFVGFEIGDIFVAGYGLDFRQRYRNLPFICTLKSELLAADSV
jgi:hypoxanthine phosphoribosyltransferase